MTRQAEAICAQLDMPYRRLEIVTGDLGFSATKKYDIEMWSPGCDEWLEVSSCSNTEDFQARRAMLRYYPSGTKKTRFLHTLNGSGLATPRVMIAIMENNQRSRWQHSCTGRAPSLSRWRGRNSQALIR